MKKLMIVLLSLYVLQACREERTADQIKAEIYTHKEAIKKLETELANSGESGKTKKLLKVVVQEAKKRRVKHTFRYTGTVKAQKIAYISPQMNGQVQEILVKEGQRVAKGQVLIKLNSDVILSSIAELKTGLSLATVLYNKQKSLWEKGVGKEIDYLQAKSKKESLEAKLRTLRAQYKMTQVRAPFAGIVDHIYPKVGEMAGPVRQVIDLVNMDTMEVEIDVSEKYIPYIHQGDTILVSFPTYDGLTKISTVNHVGNIINVANRTFRVVIKIDNKDGKIKPNMIAVAQLSDYEGENITVPSIIIKKDRRGEYVYVAETRDSLRIARKVYVQTGMNVEDNTIIEKGLKEGDRVIVKGYNLVNPGVEVSIQQ